MVAPNTNSKTAAEDKDYWATPDEIYRGALEYFKGKGFLAPSQVYTVDVCASKHNKKHPNYIDEKRNALMGRWSGEAEFLPTAWCNPPYSRGKKELFIDKALVEAGCGVTTIMLLPNDTSAEWFSTCVKHALAVAFICNGRLSFIHNGTGERKHGNNAGSILVLFSPNAETGRVARTLYVTRERLEKLGAKR